MGEIFDAIRKFEERKDAGVGPERDNDTTTDDDGARLILSGLELDLDELHEARMASAKAAIAHINFQLEEGASLDEAITHITASLWIDGVATGMMIEQARK